MSDQSLQALDTDNVQGGQGYLEGAQPVDRRSSVHVSAESSWPSLGRLARQERFKGPTARTRDPRADGGR